MVWLIGKGDTAISRHDLGVQGVFRPPGLEPSIPLSSGHRNRGAPWEVARDNMYDNQNDIGVQTFMTFGI